jgi:hypothetical protein
MASDFETEDRRQTFVFHVREKTLFSFSSEIVFLRSGGIYFSVIK